VLQAQLQVQQSAVSGALTGLQQQAAQHMGEATEQWGGLQAQAQALEQRQKRYEGLQVGAAGHQMQYPWSVFAGIQAVLGFCCCVKTGHHTS
jgi:hypothetical protein